MQHSPSAMVPYLLFILVASAVGVLSKPQPLQLNTPGLKIVRVYHGKDKIKEIIARSPHIPYQLIGKPDPAFPKSQFGKKGLLKVLAVLSGKEAIARFVYDTNVKVRLPQVVPSAGGGQLLQGGRGRPQGGRRKPMTYEEEMEAWNNGEIDTVPKKRYPAAFADQQPLRGQRTYEEEVQAWNDGESDHLPKRRRIPISTDNSHSQTILPQEMMLTLKKEIKMWNNGLGGPPVFPPMDGY